MHYPGRAEERYIRCRVETGWAFFDELNKYPCMVEGVASLQFSAYINLIFTFKLLNKNEQERTNSARCFFNR